MTPSGFTSIEPSVANTTDEPEMLTAQSQAVGIGVVIDPLALTLATPPALMKLTVRGPVLLTCTSPTEVALRNLDRKSTRLNSSHVSISYAVFWLKTKKVTVNLLTRYWLSCDC